VLCVNLEIVVLSSKMFIKDDVDCGFRFVSIFIILCIDSALLFVHLFAEFKPSVPKLLKFISSFGFKVLLKYCKKFI
jgi:hypothetical protein